MSALLTTAVAPLRRRLGGLAYVPEATRDLRIDFLRGFAVFAMVVDHLAGPSRLYWLTGGNHFFTSAAEGFVFISGLVVGMVYRRLAEREGLGPAMRRLLERAWLLYLLTVGLTLVVLPLSELLNLPWAQGIDLHNPLALLWGVFTLHQTYYLVDIPLLYALLLLVSPLALLLLYERRAWIVLVVSGVLWAGNQVFPDASIVPWPIAGNYLFYFSAWQVLFFTAMVLGYHRDRVRTAVPGSWRRPLLVVSGLGFAALLVLFRYTDPILRALASMGDPSMQAGQSPQANLVEALFAKGDVRPGRLVASAVVFLFLFLITTEFWKPLNRMLGWLLLPLGQSALYAYSAHIAVAMGMAIVGIATRLPFPNSPGANALIQIASIMLIWAAIRLRVLYPGPTQRRWWLASPAFIALGLLLVLSFVPQSPGLESPVAQAASPAARAARVFGTPVPRNLAQEAARIGATPVPLPPPPPALQVSRRLPAGEPAASEYVGQLHGSFRELQFYSQALDADMSYYIYLPKDYGTAGRRYPVLYMLHGGGGDKEEWPAYGLIDAVDDLINAKEIRPLVVVLPQGDYSYWVNHVDGGERWGDYVARDLVRHIDSSFRTLRNPQNRAIGGLSMGGFGALVQAFTHPNVFQAVAAHSPSLRAEDQLEELKSILGSGAEFARRDPINLAVSAPGLEQLQIWVDMGEEDPWLQRADVLNEILDARGIEHEWNVFAGDHSGEYWQSNLVTYLRFYDRVLNWRYVP